MYKKFKQQQKNQNIMETLATILFTASMTFVFTGFVKLVKFIK